MSPRANPLDIANSRPINAEEFKPPRKQHTTRPEPQPKPEGEAAWEPPRIATNYADDYALPEMTSAAVEALAQAPGELETYRRGNRLVTIDDITIRELDKDALRLRLAKVATFTALKRDRSGDTAGGDDGYVEVTVNPPRPAVDGLFSSPDVWSGIRELRGVVRTPILRPDGSVLSEPGYDPATCLFYAPDVEYDGLPERPTRTDAERALIELEEIIRDFPFISPESRSAALAMLLTPLATRAISGSVPGFLVIARERGTGKTLLSRLPSLLACGQSPELVAPSRSDEENRKRITALLTGAPANVVVDNIQGRLEGPSWATLLTSRTWKDRRLGRNDQSITLANDTAWTFNGNNVVTDDDLAQRLLLVDLEAKEERPDLRPAGSFANPQLETWLISNRRRLVPAALTVLRAGLLAGRETPTPQLGRFAEWSRVVLGPLVWLGRANPATESNKRLAEGDTTTTALRDLMDAWEGLFESQPQTLSNVIGNGSEELREALEEFIGPKELSTRSLSYALRSAKGRRLDGRFFEPGPRGRARTWILRTIRS